MSSIYGENLKLSIFGQSHGPAIGMTLDGIPAGLPVDTDQLQHLAGFGANFLRRQLAMELDHFCDLIAHALNRIQRGHRILEDHGDLCAADMLHSLFGKLRNIFAPEQDLSTGHLTDLPGQKPHDAAGRCGFSGAGFTNQPGNRAFFDVKGNSIDRFHTAVVHRFR